MWDNYCCQYCWKRRRRRRTPMMSCCHCWCLYWHCRVTEMLETTWRPMMTIWIQGSQDGAGSGGWMTMAPICPSGMLPVQEELMHHKLGMFETARPHVHFA